MAKPSSTSPGHSPYGRGANHETGTALSCFERGGIAGDHPAAGSAIQQSPSPKEFTEHDQDSFLDEALEFIANFFENSLQELKAQSRS